MLTDKRLFKNAINYYRFLIFKQNFFVDILFFLYVIKIAYIEILKK